MLRIFSAVITSTPPASTNLILKRHLCYFVDNAMKFPKLLRAGAIAVFSVAFVNAGVTYTCAPNITATMSNLCNTLNTTTAALYTNTFSNINASIYIEFGSTDLGESNGYLNFVTYAQFAAAISARASASGNPVLTAAVTALNTYAQPIYGNSMVELSTALARNLGFTFNGNKVVGIDASGNNFCTNLGGTGCYDGIITITNDPGTVLYYRTGTEPANAFDFFGVVEHETDEVLGTSSCIDTTTKTLSNDCGTGLPSAVDLFRYSGAGKLIADSSLSTVPGAYFSYNGGATNGADGAVYNTLDNGDDYADFVSTCSSVQHIQDAEDCAGHDANIDITNDGGAEINILNALGYTLVPTTVSTLPVISQSGVVAHGGKSTTIEPGAFIDIYGTNLSATTQTAIFNGNFPTTLDNVEVKIDGKSAYVYYVSSGLINVQAPDDTALGTVNVTVTNSVGTSAAVTATLGQVGPTFFTLDGTYVAGVIPTPNGSGFYQSGSYDLVGPTKQFLFNTRPANNGEVVELFASGFGAGKTPVPAGQVDAVTPAPQTISSPVTVTIGGIPQTVPVFIVGAGLWQMNVTIPQGLAAGNYALQAMVAGVTTPTGVLLAIQ